MKEKINLFINKTKLIALLSLIFTILHFFIVKNRDKVTFHMPENPRMYMYGIIFLAILTCYLLYFIFFYTIHLLRTKNITFLSYFKYFCLYGCIMGIFFLLTWPGVFKGDEFYVIKSALSFSLSPAQTGLTSIFYIIALLIFPSMATICLFQLLIICMIFSYIMKNISDFYQGKIKWFIMIAFLLLPVIDGNLFTLRATLVGWLFLFSMCQLFFTYKKGNLSLVQMIFMALIGGLVIAWRSEFIYLILFLPLACLWLHHISIKKAFLMLLIIAISFECFNIPNKIALNGSNKYPISLVINPLGNLFTEEEKLKGPCVYDDIMTINELIDVRLLRQTASVRNISQYWNIDDILPKEQLNRFMTSSIRLIVYNPTLFLKYRCLTFLHTNGFYPNEINHPGGENVSAINELIYYDQDYKNMFVFMNAPLGQSLREKTIGFLACRHYDKENTTTSPLLIVFYNCLPALFLLLIAFIFSITLRKKEFIAIIIMVLAQLALIFLTAPAMFFMYYFCFYLCGYFFSILFFIDWASNKNKK